jgi:RNA recognition motif-containing protein
MWPSYNFASIDLTLLDSESTSIPVNPRTNRPVGYAFVDLKTAEEAEKAISNLSGQEILERKVSVQLARKPEHGSGTEGAGEGAEGAEKRASGRGRGRGRGRGGRGRGGARSTTVCYITDQSPVFR